MRRIELQEIHDHPRFPALLRDLVTDALQAVWNFGNSYKPVVSRLLSAVELSGTRRVLDLCSGGGGPWLRLVQEPEFGSHEPITVRFTDKYPNLPAFSAARSRSSVLDFEPEPVEATAVPEELPGFRTMFSSFHHFGPEPARRLLKSAMEQGRGIGIFEVAHRSALTVLTIFALPALIWWLTLAMRPFRWSRLFWTYVVPVVPFVVFYDGIVSCLRTYSQEELRELVEPFSRPEYRWEVGEEQGGRLPVTYLIGYPVIPREPALT